MNAPGLPENTRLSEVHLRVAHLDRVLPFYEKILGLAVVHKEIGRVVLNASKHPGGFLHLIEDPNAVPHPKTATGLYHFALLFPTRVDLAHALKRLLLHDWPIDGAANHLVSEAIYLRDPENNGIELYADSPRSEWQWQDGQVQMATEALDLEGLLALAGIEQTQERAPASTRLGHIHLHVADLAESERFFHAFLGFAVTQRHYPGALFFSAGGYHHHIGANTWAGKAAPPSQSTGLIAYRVEVPHKTVLQALKERASIFGYEMFKDTSAAGAEILRVKDPSGSWLELAGT